MKGIPYSKQSFLDCGFYCDMLCSNPCIPLTDVKMNGNTKMCIVLTDTNCNMLVDYVFLLKHIEGANKLH